MKGILLIVALLCLVGAASATDYYVSTTGDNSSNGLTVGAAWRNITYAIDNIGAGDTLYLINGTWVNDSIDLKTTGTLDNPITITAYNGTPTLDGVTIDASNRYGIYAYTGTITDIHISDITIQDYYISTYLRSTANITIDNVTMIRGYQGCQIIDSNNVTIQNSLITEHGTSTIGNSLMMQANYANTYDILIQNNEIRDNHNHNLVDMFNYDPGADYIVSNITIINNELHNTTYQAMFQHTGATASKIMSDINFSYNLVYDCKNGIRLDCFKDTIIDSNRIHDNEVYGITSTSAVYCSANNISITNNSVWDIDTPQGAVYFISSGTQVFLSNNITWYTCRTSGNLTATDSLKQNYTIQKSASPGILITNFTDGTIFTEDGASTVYYYPTDSRYTTTTNETVEIVSYNTTAVPVSDNITLTSINTYSNDMYNFTFDSAASISTSINVTVDNETTYNVTKNGAFQEEVIAGSDSIVQVQVDIDGSTDVEVSWTSDESWLPGEYIFVGRQI